MRMIMKGIVKENIKCPTQLPWFLSVRIVLASYSTFGYSALKDAMRQRTFLKNLLFNYSYKDEVYEADQK